MTKNSIKILKSKSEIAKYAAKIIKNQIEAKPNTILGLATGNTMLPLYKELIKLKINFKKVKTFNLDEYCGLKPKNKTSFRYFMEKNLFKHVNIKKSNINFLRGDKKDYKKECSNYERKIKSLGGIDLQILGIGQNGHIAFNEPGSSFKSKTRRIKLTTSTKKANSSDFNSYEKVPNYALTMGIGTIMKSKQILLIANGKHKREVIKKTLSGKITTKVPASILRKHKNTKFILDLQTVSGNKLLNKLSI